VRGLQQNWTAFSGLQWNGDEEGSWAVPEPCFTHARTLRFHDSRYVMTKE